ncbi:synaptojanin-2-binding protein isoform X2 [Ochotona curzoniae]|uniref:synaptojanin-2-binding protein isoform X2 n=1 Tax=Ochotona curzoniae TaxID=130825 RepID=UPI001B34DC0C|nr:synaptojanin-2-binding protein isoform X2 [Ochotona curzoniae]
MNERGTYLVTEEEIHLTRGPSGLGFNIVGGTDQQYVSNDTGIYVSRIKENGAAALDGRLQEGDKILSVNGHDLKNILHQDAVNLFRNAGYAVCLRVQHRLLIVGGSFGLREFSQIRYDAVKIKIDPELEKKLKMNKVSLESEYEKIKDSAFDDWKNIRGPRPWEDPDLLQGRNPETLKKT